MAKNWVNSCLIQIGVHANIAYFLWNMEQESLVEIIKDPLSAEFAKFGVKFAVLFGSVAMKQETPLSDIDIAVYSDHDGFLNLAGSLSGGLFGRKIDLVNLRSISSFDCYEILSGGELIFVSPGEGEGLYRRCKFQSMIRYLDFEGARRRMMYDMKKRIEEGRYGRPAAEIERSRR